MERIASFTVNHDRFGKGMYISRVDGDVVSYDVRMKKPNGGEYLPVAAAHTLEHLLATFMRNGEYADSVVYVGPMGCRTGFYILLRDKVAYATAIEFVKAALAFARDYEGEIPGNTRQECGNYLEHDLVGAKAIAADMCEVLKNWAAEMLNYEVHYE